MRLFLLNIGLAIAWAGINGSFSAPVLMAGFVVGYIVILLGRPVLGPSAYYTGLWRTLSFIVIYVWELVTASIRIAIDVLNPWLDVRPAVVRVPLQVRSDAEVTLLANLISLTPGTLSLDVSDDNRSLFVHAMDVDDADALRRELHDTFERRVLHLTGQQHVDLDELMALHDIERATEPVDAKGAFQR